MKDFAPYQYIVEKAIARLGVDPSKCLINRANWQLKKGNIRLNISFFEQGGLNFFKAEALITTVPTNADAAFYLRLLTYNAEFNGLAFYVKEDKVLLKSVREVSGMDANEAFAMITKVGNYADKFEEEF